MTAEKQALEAEAADAKTARKTIESEFMTLQTEAMKLKGTVSVLQLEKQGLESAKDSLQWQLKNQETKLQVCGLTSCGAARADARRYTTSMWCGYTAVSIAVWCPLG